MIMIMIVILKRKSSRKRKNSFFLFICDLEVCNIISRVAYCRQVRASRSPTQRPTPRIRTRYYHYQYRISYLPLSATIDYYRYRLPLLLLPLLPLLLPLLLPIVLRLLLNEPNEQRVSSSRRDLAR